MKDIKLDINTKQYDGKKIIDNIDLSVNGNIYIKNKETYIIYKEENEGSKCTTMIKIYENKITVKKMGSITSLMVFEEGKKTPCKYITPQGVFHIEIDTEELSIVGEDENISNISIKYDIDIMNIFNGRNEMTIKIS